MKDTKAFSLKPMEKVELVKIDFKDKLGKMVHMWVPPKNASDKHIFVYGKGLIKIPKKAEHAFPTPLSEDWTAEQIKVVYNQYGFSGAQGMLHGWGNLSLWDDMSYGLAYYKHELGNMCLYGKSYDEFTDKVQEIGNKFVAKLLDDGFRLEGDKWLWYGKNLVCDLRNHPIHPLRFIDHCVHGLFPIAPSFNSIGFDTMLEKLFVGKYGMSDDYGGSGRKGARPILDRIVSVRDRIAHLTNEEIADSFQDIFELQKRLFKHEK